ncbi:MAG: membrane dipeptidase [Ardenticatenaceae bacterium]|nr:membrane dipeptidase [Anaerolineales bacterium]MCB8922504.1 membrane dipeptidase [Ardenticatenaceae bacterium]MCB8989973.1 membrane dipeptidase [Ardenticatenaceae bacterium]MCB9005416.1 membrane dipeptidase [Ardenticatenaceae bacterium]
MIVDAHLDLAYNELVYGRNLRQPLAKLRAQNPKPGPRGIPIVTIPELQKGGVGLVFGTLFVMPAAYKVTGLDGGETYHTAEQAHRQAMAQLDYYHRLADEDDTIRLVTDSASLDTVIASHEPGSAEPPLLGIVPLMEGADPIREPEEAELWHARGLRLIGLAWDDTRYAHGAWRSGEGLTGEGHRLLEVMAQFRFIADLTHMSERASLETLERYAGPVVATHSNVRDLVDGRPRHLSNQQISLLGERNGVIGIVLFNKFLKADYQTGNPNNMVTLNDVVAHIDHICQLLGDADHVGIGSDFDGGFGAADIPAEMNSAADLPLIAAKLHEKGYEEAHISKIMGENWVNLLRRAWA